MYPRNQTPEAIAALAAILISSAFLTQDLQAQTQPPVVDQVPIDEGFVIVDGRYLPKPYTVALVDQELSINNVNFGAVQQLDWTGPRRGNGRRFRDMDEPRQNRSASAISYAEQMLLNGGMIIRFEDQSVHLTRDSYSVLNTLLGDQEENKLRTLSNSSRRQVSLSQWASLLDNFEKSPALEQRWEKMQADRQKVYEQATSSKPLSGSAMYGLTVLGMVLTVSAFGVVLSYKPKRGMQWQEINEQPEAVGLVWSCATLVAALSVFDLVLTLMFRNSAGFWELNPLGGSMLAEPWWLTAFKIGATAISVAILLGLRKYRGGQLAAWWTCLALTLLTARWVAFNSMLIV